MIITEEIILNLLKLMPLLNKVVIKPFEASFAEEDITPLQMMTFFRIEERKQMIMSDIASDLSISKQHATQIVNALEEKGLIKRFIDLQNRRCTIVTLTDRGNMYIQLIDQRVIEFLKPLFSEFALDEKEEFLDALNLILQYLQRI